MGNTIKLLLKQSIGGPVVPCVKKGDEVNKGSLLGSPEGLGVPLHASVSGKVVEVNETLIEITANENQSDDYEKISGKGSIADIAKEAGICGLGGAGFPTYVKLGTDLNGGTLLINAAECEPLLKHNIKQIITEPEKVYQGALLAKKATNAGNVIFGIKSKNKEAIDTLRAVIKPEDKVTIHELPDMYPMGEERALIRESMGILLEPDKLPSAAGAVVLNLETAGALFDAVEERKPFITKNLTVVGKLHGGPQSHLFMNTPIGTLVEDLINLSGGIDGKYGEIVMGGPFTGKACQLGDPITKTTGGILVSQEFVRETRPMGLLVCACGGDLVRMKDMAAKMGSKVVSVRACKQAKNVKGALKCENPGECPGQAEKIMEMKREGAQVLLVGNCSDCTNTVMCVAPKLKMPVYHQTDNILRTVGQKIIRRLPVEGA